MQASSISLEIVSSLEISSIP